MAIDQLMQRFAAFVRTRPGREPTPDAEPAPAFPADLAHIREVCGHHIIPLALISRADGDSVPAERAVIEAHCLSLLKKAGIAPGEAERAAVAECVAQARPAMVQLDPAVARVAAEGEDSVHRLIAAAILVIEADGKRDPGEVDVLNALSEELAHLRR